MHFFHHAKGVTLGGLAKGEVPIGLCHGVAQPVSVVFWYWNDGWRRVNLRRRGILRHRQTAAYGHGTYIDLQEQFVR